MDPVALRTERLVLDQPTQADVDDITEYCRDPLFEDFMLTPWPYRREHAEGFVREYVPNGWASGTEATWAIREREGGPLLGVIGTRFARPDFGYWLGAPHRRRGIMREASTAVLDWLFEDRGADHAEWECVVGNLASARLARSLGFTFTGTAPATGSRPGRETMGWHGVLRPDDPRTPRPGWPDGV